MKDLPLIWKFPDHYKIMLSPLDHSQKCRDSGYAEILIEAELVTSGCPRSVLTGKACVKALFFLKAVSEVMEQLVIGRFVEEQNVEVSNPVALFNLVQTCSDDNLDLAMKNLSTLVILQKYMTYEE